MRRAVERRVGGALAGQLGAGGDAEHHGTRLLHAPHRQRALRRHEVLEEPRALGDTAPLDPDIVLDDEGHAQKRGGVAAGEAGIGRGRGETGPLGVDQHERVQLGVEPGDPREMPLGHLARRQALLAKRQRDPGGRRGQQRVCGHSRLSQLRRSDAAQAGPE